MKKAFGLVLVLALSLAVVGAASAAGSTNDKPAHGKFGKYKPKHSQADYKLAFKTHLNGANEVPEPVKTDTTGKAAFLVNHDYTKMKFVLKIRNGSGIFGAAGAHIHCGVKGENGPVLVFLAGMLPGGLYGDIKVRGTLTDANVVIPTDGDKPAPTVCGKVTINTLHDVVQAMKDGYAYVNVHSTDYPGGVVRGQIYPTSVNYAYKIVHPKAYRYHKHMAKRTGKRHGDKRECRAPNGIGHKGKNCPI